VCGFPICSGSLTIKGSWYRWNQDIQPVAHAIWFGVPDGPCARRRCGRLGDYDFTAADGNCTRDQRHRERVQRRVAGANVGSAAWPLG
jgi:hypothetical protein